jgi:DNA-binding response OmpR family regulator
MSPATRPVDLHPPDTELTIAIIEDQMAIAELLRDVLEDAGYQPHIITSPFSALDEIRKIKADIVLLDIMMPGRNGWEVLDDLRAEAETRELPVILTSAVYDRIGRRPLPFGGPIRFASKPFEIGDLIDTIDGFRDRALA